MALLRGGGHIDRSINCSCIADSTLGTILDGFKTAGTKLGGKYVRWDFSQNYGVTSPADGEAVNGEIIKARKVGSYWHLSCKMWSYTDQNSVEHALVDIINVHFVETFALQDSIVANSSTITTVKDGGTGGFGACVAKDTPTTDYGDILI